MNKKFIQVSIAVIFLLTACGQVTKSVTPLGTGASPQSQRGISTSTPVLIQSKTPREPCNESTSRSVTPTAIPSITPTFNVKNIVTATLALAATCPEITGNVPINLPEKRDYIPDNKKLENGYIKPILNYLNNGGVLKNFLEN